MEAVLVALSLYSRCKQHALLSSTTPGLGVLDPCVVQNLGRTLNAPRTVTTKHKQLVHTPYLPELCKMPSMPHHLPWLPCGAAVTGAGAS